MERMADRRARVVTMTSSFVILPLVTLALMFLAPISGQLSDPMSCSAVGTSCPAYLYYTLGASNTLEDVANLFSVTQADLLREATGEDNSGVFVSVTCLCSDSLTYLAQTAYRVNSVDSTEASIAAGPYENLALVINKRLVMGQILEINLYCGCIDSPGQRLLTYVLQDGDNLKQLAHRFNDSTTTLININNISDPDFLVTQMIYYFPVTDFDLKPVVDRLSSSGPERGSGGIAPGAIVGIILAALLLIGVVAALIFLLQNRKLRCYKPTRPPFDARASPGGSISGRNSRSMLGSLFRCGFLGFQDSSLNYKLRPPTSSSLSREMINGVFGMEKPVIFGNDEIKVATSNFKESNQLGAGAYGCVYFGLLRNQEVAIKKMKATNTKEFLAELNVLCKVHHANLVELIGYSVSDEELYLVYEYAENRSVSDRLHKPLLKGYTPLTWNARVQIALDAARGLEYIHEHTKAHYVHRDVKTSNILLDGYFRAKVADFGLAKLVEQSNDVEAVTHTIGTVGYIAPECRRGGKATAKSDVYAFGVVLFELITGEEAMLRSKTSESGRRSLVYIVLSALGDCSSCNLDKLKAIADPLLQDMYPLDSIFKMATLGKQCVEEDPQERLDTKHIVFTLSQILLSSIEWEATLAGNSQIFSGLIQGR